MEDSNKQSASENSELSHIRLVSPLQTEINSISSYFVDWLNEALEGIMLLRAEVKPITGSNFEEHHSRTGQLLAEKLISGSRWVGMRIYSDSREVLEMRWLQLAPHRLKLVISPHGAIGHPARRADYIVYALFLELLSVDYPETKDHVDRTLPLDWMAQLWPEHSKAAEWLVSGIVLAPKSKPGPRTSELYDKAFERIESGKMTHTEAKGVYFKEAEMTHPDRQARKNFDEAMRTRRKKREINNK